MTVLDRVPLERISAEARQIQFGRIFLQIVMGFFYSLGWVAAKTLGVLGTTLGWTVAAVKTGWRDARQAHAVRGGR